MILSSKHRLIVMEQHLVDFKDIVSAATMKYSTITSNFWLWERAYPLDSKNLPFRVTGASALRQWPMQLRSVYRHIRLPLLIFENRRRSILARLIYLDIVLPLHQLSAGALRKWFIEVFISSSSPFAAAAMGIDMAYSAKNFGTLYIL
jgi:hypothetical protein